MSLHKFKLENIAELDGGKAMETFLDAMRVAVKDCDSRPGDKRPRKVVLQMTMKPNPIMDGNTIECESVDANFQCKTLLPHYETQNINFGIQNSGDLVFNPDSPRAFNQATLLADEDE